jgi:hypothetical protein
MRTRYLALADAVRALAQTELVNVDAARCLRTRQLPLRSLNFAIFLIASVSEDRSGLLLLRGRANVRTCQRFCQDRPNAHHHADGALAHAPTLGEGLRGVTMTRVSRGVAYDRAMAKIALGVMAGLVVAVLAGWLYGRSGQFEMSTALDTAELQVDLLGARAAALDARVAVYNVNFGEASKHLENARGMLERANRRLTDLDRDAEVAQLKTALASVDEAQRMAAKLDQGANSRAGDVAKVLADMLATSATR